MVTILTAVEKQRLDDGVGQSGAVDLDFGDDGHHDDQEEDYTPSIAPADLEDPAPSPGAALPINVDTDDVDTIPTEPGENTPLNSSQPEPGHEPSIPPSVPDSPSSTTRSRSHRGDPPPALTLDPEIASLYEPAGPEDFAARRLRFDRQEVQGYGPQRARPSAGASVQPYETQSAPSLNPISENPEAFSQAFSVEEVDTSALPPGWTMDEEGYFQLSDRPMDFWEIRAGCLIRHHLLPRFAFYQIKKTPDPDIPIEPQYLDSLRVTVSKFADGTVEISTDDGIGKRAYPRTWIGMTIYQVSGAARKELCMYSSLPAKKIAKDTRSKFARAQKKVDKGGVSERHLTLEERLQFQSAKQKELRSFFENQVWEFDSI